VLKESFKSEGDATAKENRLTHHGHMVLGPRFLPPACETCAVEIAYSARNPDGFPALRAVAVDGSGSRQLTTRYLGSTMGVASSIVVFDQQELRRNVALQSDLYVFDQRTGSTRALTRGQRLQDPDLSPDGRTIACVRQNRDRRDLVIARLASNPGSPVDVERIEIAEIVALVSEADTQFNAPRWSPDGKTLVVERQRLAELPQVVLVDVHTRAVRVVAASSTARFVTPAWRPDGQAIVAATDGQGGSFNLYEYPLAALPSRPRQLTHMAGGALWPDISHDGKTMTFAGYTADGFDVFVMPYTDGRPGTEPDAQATPTAPLPEIARRAAPPAESYAPWGTLQPTSWIPILETGTDYARAGVATSGYDVLARHAYSASATWLVSGPEGVDHTPATPDWSVAYAYDRWRPTFFVSSSRTTFFAAGEPDQEGRPTPGTLRETEVEAGIAFPVRHVRRTDRAVASIVRTEGRFISGTENLSDTRTAFRLGAATSSARMYGYSISPEHGVTAGATAELRPRASDNLDAAILTADLRAFVPGIGRHHVVALRAAGGAASGDHDLHRRFLMGGAGPDSSVLDFGRTAFSLLRAFPDHAFAGTRAGLVNVDYRWPIARPQRGAGTWPLLLHTIHASAFADAGHVWSGRFRAADVKSCRSTWSPDTRSRSC
jgi:Tol biopolymer transport system component